MASACRPCWALLILAQPPSPHWTLGNDCAKSHLRRFETFSCVFTAACRGPRSPGAMHLYTGTLMHLPMPSCARHQGKAGDTPGHDADHHCCAWGSIRSGRTTNEIQNTPRTPQLEAGNLCSIKYCNDLKPEVPGTSWSTCRIFSRTSKARPGTQSLMMEG